MIDTLLSVWLATTAKFVLGSTATATGPGRVGNGFALFRRAGVEGSITERVLFLGFTVTATFVSGLNAPATLPVSTGPGVVPVPAPRKLNGELVWSSRLRNETRPLVDGSTRTAC